MAIGTIVLIGIYGCLFLKKNSIDERFKWLLLLEILLDLWHLQGSFLCIGSTRIGYRYVNEIILFFYSAYYILLLKKINKRILVGSLVVFAVVFMALGREVIIPYDEPIINAWNPDINWDEYANGYVSKEKLILYPMSISMLIFQLISFVFIIVICKQTYDRNKLKWLLDKTISYSYPLILYGYLEFFLKNILGNADITFLITRIILGEGDAAYTVPTVRGVFMGLQGFTREPSHYATFLGEISILYLIACRIDGFLQFKTAIKVISVLLLMSISGSFVGFYYIAMFVLIYAYLFMSLKKINKMFVIKCILGILAVIGIFNYIDSDGYVTKRIEAAVQVLEYISSSQIGYLSKTGDSSLPRMLSIWDGMEDFKNNFLIGVGIGIESVHSPMVAMLLNFGLVGMSALLYITCINRYDKCSYDFVFVAFFFFIYQIFSGREFGLEIITYFFIEVTSLYTSKGKSIVYGG